MGGDPLDPTRAHFRAHQNSRTNCGNRDFSQERIQQRTGGRLSTFPYHRWWKKSWKRFSENRRLVVCTGIVSPLENFLISVEVEKFPRASSSGAGRPRQVAADRARAGEKFLMGHFPASPSMCRLAGSSGTLEQDWRQALEQKSRAPPARPRGDITSQSHSVPARAPTRELEGTPRRRGHSRKCLHMFWDFGSLFVP